MASRPSTSTPAGRAPDWIQPESARPRPLGQPTLAAGGCRAMGWPSQRGHRQASAWRARRAPGAALILIEDDVGVTGSVLSLLISRPGLACLAAFLWIRRRLRVASLPNVGGCALHRFEALQYLADNRPIGVSWLSRNPLKRRLFSAG